MRRYAAQEAPQLVTAAIDLRLSVHLRKRLRDLAHELFCCVLLDNKNRVIKVVELFRGTIDGASVHPREVVKLALVNNAAALILVHNHPLCDISTVTT